MKQFCKWWLCIFVILGVAGGVTSAQAEWMPDPNLRQAIRETQEIPEDVPLTIKDLQNLFGLVVLSSDISNLQGLAHADESAFLQLALPNIKVCEGPGLPVEDRVEKRDYPSVFACYNRGTARTLIGEYEAAIADFDEAICLKPEFVEAYYNRGLTKSTLNQPKAAEHDLRTALKLAKQQGHDNIKVNIKQRLQEFNDTE